MKKMLVLCAGFALVSSGLFAEEIDGHKVLYYRGTAAYWSAKQWSSTSDGAKQYWENDSIAVISSANINFPQTNPLNVYGIRWSNNNDFQWSGTGALCLGAGGILLSNNMDFQKFSGANKLRLTASQTWTGASDTKTYSINMNASNN